MQIFRWIARLLLVLILSDIGATTASATTLGIAGSQMTVDGQPTFLLGFSYYGGLGADEATLRRDLEDAQRAGFNWLRVWVTWENFGTDVSAVDERGEVRQPFLLRLKNLVAECDRRGFIVDLTFARGLAGDGSQLRGLLRDQAAHERAIRILVPELKRWRNWYLDLANERDVRDARFVSSQEIGRLRDLVRQLDPQRLVTASFGGHDLDEQDFRQALDISRLDFITPHRPRTPKSPGQTAQMMRQSQETMQRLGRVVPIIYQEPFRRGYTAWEPTSEDFWTDFQGAVTGGAAGWCFHNGTQKSAADRKPRRSFDVTQMPLFEQLDAEERAFVNRLVAQHGLKKQSDDRKPNTEKMEDSKVQVLRTGEQGGHYLAWRGRPVLLIGDSVTQGWMECGSHFQQRDYLDALASRGINLVMLWAFKGTDARRQIQDKRVGYDAPELWPWGGSPDQASFDLQKFNPEYFTRMKSLVTEAEKRGIVVLITIHDGWTKTCFDGHPFNRRLGNGPLQDRRQYVNLADYDREMPKTFDSTWSAAERNQYFQERFCARLIEELNPFSNVLYEMFNEGEWYDKTARRRHEQHFLAFFRARCRNVLLSNCDHLSGFREHDEPNLDVISLHPFGWVGASSKFVAGFRQRPMKPYFYSEPVPEFDGREPTLDVVRRSVWETTLAGAGWVNQNDLSFGWDSHTTVARLAGVRDQAYDYVGHCARFFNQSNVHFWRLAPEPELASTSHCLASRGVEYVVYTPQPGEFTVDLSAAGGKRLQTRWYDPTTGKFKVAQGTVGGNVRVSFRSPFSKDGVLHLVVEN